MGSSAPVQAPVVEEEADLESMDNHSSPAPEKANNTKNQRKLSPGMKALIIMMMKMLMILVFRTKIMMRRTGEEWIPCQTGFPPPCPCPCPSSFIF